jgi:hypothetical protein
MLKNTNIPISHLCAILLKIPLTQKLSFPVALGYALLHVQQIHSRTSDILNNIPKNSDTQIHTLKVRAPYQLSEYQYRGRNPRATTYP